MENKDIKISDFKIAKGDWIAKPVDSISPFYNKVLYKHKNIDLHFLNKDSKFGYKNKDYLKVIIFCKNLDDGLIEKDKILAQYLHLEVLYIKQIGSKGQDWRSDIWKYGNAIEIIFIP